MYNLGCTQRECQTSKDIVDNYRTMFESRISVAATKKLPVPEKSDATFFHGPMIILADKTTQQSHKVATPCIDDHQFKEEEMGSVEELSTVCSQIVLTCLHWARIGYFMLCEQTCQCRHKNGLKPVTNVWRV